MNKKLYIIGVLLLTLSIVSSPVAAHMVQDQAAAGTTTATANPVPMAQIAEGNGISFSDLQETDILLSGPYDANTILFGLPADWKLLSGTELELLMTVSFNTDTAATVAASDVFRSLGGIMIVRFNNVVVGTLQLNQQGNVVQSLAIPQSALVSQRSDGRMELDFTLDSGMTCQVNQQMNVIIHPSSRFGFPLEMVTPDTSLVNFPRPLYQDSIYPDQAIVVIPDHPSADELQSALTVAAGLGNLTRSMLTMTLATVSELTPEQKAAHNLIVVGNVASLPILAELGLPGMVKDGLYQINGSNVDDGIIQMVNSPWSPSSVILLVSGNTDTGTVKAAQAVSTGVLRPYNLPNIAVIGDVSPNPTQVASLVDQNLSDLGYGMDVLTRDGVSTATYNFYIPAGQTVDENAYFDLIYGHSALLNYDRSGVVVLLNNQPVGSIRFGDESAVQSNNHLKIVIPASAVLPGMNRVDVRATLTMRDTCINPTSNAQWFAIWPDSRLYLPLNVSPVKTESLLGLDSYPEPYILEPTLGTTAFVLQQDSPASWASALQIAAYLGDRANGVMTSLAAFYGDTTDPAMLSDYHLLVIGRPSQMPIVNELNANLPAPFVSDNDMASESAMTVDYRIPENASIGYVQFLNSPWNADHIVMAALGNTDQGVNWAATALVDAQLRSRLAGNFAAVNGQQVISADTRLSTVILESNTVNEVNLVPESTNIDLSPQPAERPAWILPAIIVVVALVLMILLAGLVLSWRRNKAQNNG